MSALSANPRDDPRAPIARWEVVALLLAMAVGAVVRYWGLSTVPPGLWYDEAINGLDALSIVREPGLPLFFDTRGHPREPLFMYLNLPGVLLGGTSATTLRALSALIGTLTIPAVWWMARTLAGPRVALAALVAFTFMRWHVHFSRLSFRTIMAPLFCALILTFLVRWMRGKRLHDLVAAGALCGLSLYTYLSMRLFVVAMALLVALYLVQSRAWRGGAFPAKPMLLAAGVALLVFLPLGWHYTQNPQDFTGRQDQISLLDQGSEGLLQIAAQTRDIALMGIWRGDHEAKHNIPGAPRFTQAYIWGGDGRDNVAAWRDARAAGDTRDVHGTGLPVFDALTGMLFYAGLALIGWRAVRHRRIEETGLMLWLLFGALASVLSFGAPNMLRLQLLTPVAAMALALAAVALFDCAARTPLGGRGGVALMVALGVWFGVGETKRYFVDWPQHPETWFRFNSHFAELARHYRALDAGERPAFVYVPDYLGDAPTFLFEMDDTGIAIVSDAIEDAPSHEGVRSHFAVTRPPFPPLQRPVPANASPVRELREPDGTVWCVIFEVR